MVRINSDDLDLLKDLNRQTKGSSVEVSSRKLYRFVNECSKLFLDPIAVKAVLDSKPDIEDPDEILKRASL